MGLAGAEYADPAAFDAAYESAMLGCAVLLVLGGLISWVAIRNPAAAPMTAAATLAGEPTAG